MPRVGTAFDHPTMVWLAGARRRRSDLGSGSLDGPSPHRDDADRSLRDSWNSGADGRASANAYMATAAAGATISLPFNGTGISVIGLQDSCSGQAQVQVDGNVQTFDAYRASGGGWQRTVYSTTGLPAGSHMLTLTVLGTKQPASCGAFNRAILARLEDIVRLLSEAKH
jgi:hypothetical protein